MPPIAERAVRQSMRDARFDHSYYFFGDDDFLKEQLARELAASVVEPSAREFDVVALHGSEVSAESLDTALNTPPMLGARRVVVVREAHALSRAARAVLDAYLPHPAASTVLILSTPSGTAADKSLAAATSALDFAPLTSDRVTRWIVHHTATALGAEIQPDAAALLQDAVGSELPLLAAELEKLAAFSGSHAITTETVAETVGVRREESLGALLDAVAERDARRAVDLVPLALRQPRVNLVTATMALASQFLAIAWGQAVRERGRGGLEREYYGLLKESRVFPGRAWGEAVSCWARAVPRWTAPALDEGIRLLLAADHAAKETRVSSDEQVLTSLVLGLCAAGGSVSA